MFYILPAARSGLLEYREHFEEALDRAKRLGVGTEIFRLADGVKCAVIVSWTPPRKDHQ